MSRRKDVPKRSMRRCITVFCEGETEETYVAMLRSRYRLPIQIIPKVTGTSITPECIDKHIRQIKLSKADMVDAYLMYDLDRNDIAAKLKTCGKSVLGSKPCIEGWFILHEKNSFSSTESNECVNELKATSVRWRQYAKGTLSDTQKKLLWDNRLSASAHAQKMSSPDKCSALWTLIEVLEKEKTISE